MELTAAPALLKLSFQSSVFFRSWGGYVVARPLLAARGLVNIFNIAKCKMQTADCSPSELLPSIPFLELQTAKCKDRVANVEQCPTKFWNVVESPKFSHNENGPSDERKS